MNSRLKTAIRCLAFVGILLIATSVFACPTCKQAVAENGGDTVRGYFWSICFMMSMPFLIFGSMFILLYSQFRKAGSVDQRYSPAIAAKLGLRPHSDNRISG